MRKQIIHLTTKLEQARKDNLLLRAKLHRLQQNRPKKKLRHLKPVKSAAALKSDLIQCKLKKIFSKEQIQLLIGRKKVNWTSNDIAKALSVAAISKKAYETIRDVWHLPLPTARTLRNWGSNFKCQEGILGEVLSIMKVEAYNLDSFSRLCILKFDEVSLTSKICWDKALDMIQKPYSKAQVVMCSGICSNWNQPVYYGFDTRMTRELLSKIIVAIEGAGYLVSAIVSDFDTSNQALWKSLGISSETSHFCNPSNPERKIWAFADAPHMLKLLRNHLIDQGFELPDKTVVNIQTLERLLQVDCGELKLCPKLTRNLLTLKGAERMRVSPAAKVFSSHTAALCKFVYPKSPQIWQFFQLINDWFDILNSRVPKDSDIEIRSAYGMKKEKQDLKLGEIENLVLNMRCFKYSPKLKTLAPRPGLLPCQTGLLVSISSLRGLFEDLKVNYNVTYIKTRNLNQDVLESFFSEIRALGRTNDHPTQCDFRVRCKLLLLGAKVRPAVSANITVDANTNSTNYMSRMLLEKAVSENVLEIDDFDNTEIEEEVENEEDDSLNTGSHSLHAADCDTLTLASLTYLAGYIGFLIKKSGGEDFGDITRRQPLQDVPSCEMENIADIWIHTLSRGGLIYPNEKLIQNVVSCEDLFYRKFPPETLLNVKGITNRVKTAIEEAHPSISKFVVNSYVRTRLRIRIKFMNSKLHVNANMRNRKKITQFQRSHTS